MFAIGTAEVKVSGTKLRVPKEYNLTKKDRKIYGLWLGERTLYLSDEKEPLRAKASGKQKELLDILTSIGFDIKSDKYLKKYL